jgi:hypothetical protein
LTEFHRTNINIRKSDYKYLLDRYGQGWTTEARQIIARAVDNMKEYQRNKELIASIPIKEPKFNPEDLA